jgi:hypothetical protein
MKPLFGARKLAEKHEIGPKAACFFSWLDSDSVTVRRGRPPTQTPP